MKTYYVTVDDDIDPTNQEEVLWAMCTRVDPTTAVDMVRDAGPRISIRGFRPRVARRRLDRRTHADQRVQALRLARSIRQTNMFNAEDRKKLQAKWGELLGKMGNKKG